MKLIEVMKHSISKIALCCMLFVSAINAAGETKRSLYLNVKYDFLTPQDTLFLTFHGVLMNRIWPGQRQLVFATMNREGAFVFDLEIDESCGYFRIESNVEVPTSVRVSANPKALLESQFWESRDSIDLVISTVLGADFPAVNYKFSGRGAGKYQMLTRIRNVKAPQSNPGILQSIGREVLNGDPGFFINTSEEERRRLDILENGKEVLSESSYAVLWSEIRFTGKGAIFSAITKFYKDSLGTGEEKRRFINNYRSIMTCLRLSSGFNNKDNFKSVAYLEFLRAFYTTYSVLTYGTVQEESVFRHIMSAEQGRLREYAITYFLLSIKSKHVQISLYDKAYGQSTSLYCKRVLRNAIDFLSVRKMPFYSLSDINKDPFDLGSLYNKVVVLDFWFTGCVNCRIYYRNVLSGAKEYFKNNPYVVFVSISSDKDYTRWISSLNGGEYSDMDAINLYTSGMGARHPILVENNLNRAPSVVVLGKGGVIERFNAPSLFGTDTLIEEISRLIPN